MSDAVRVYRAKATDEEIADVLGQRLVAAVGTTNEDGSVHLAYVIFLHRGGRLYFETSSITRKARNAERTGHATMLVQGTAGTGNSLMVSTEGTVRLLRGDEARDINYRLRDKYIKADAIDDVDRAWGQVDDVAVEITPRAVRSWSSKPFHDYTQAGLAMDYDDVWRSDG